MLFPSGEPAQEVRLHKRLPLFVRSCAKPLGVARTTGMRPSEYLGLKWQDIDWIRQTVSIVRSMRRLSGKWCFSDTKRSRGRRPIKLQSWIVSLLHDLHTKANGQDSYPEAHDLVFRTQSGLPINADYLAKQFRSILDLAGVPRMRLYDLRNSDMPARPSRWTHLCSRASPHAGRSCDKNRSYAISTDGVTNR